MENKLTIEANCVGISEFPGGMKQIQLTPVKKENEEAISDQIIFSVSKGKPGHDTFKIDKVYTIEVSEKIV